MAPTLAFCVAVVFNTEAAPGDVDPSFNAGSILDSPAYTTALQPDGKVLLGGSVRDVKRSTGRQIVRIAVDGDTSMPWLADVPGVRVVRPGQDYTELDVDRGIDPETVLRAALDHQGVRVTQFLIGDPSIEEIFIEKVGHRAVEVQHLGGAATDGRTPAGVAVR